MMGRRALVFAAIAAAGVLRAAAKKRLRPDRPLFPIRNKHTTTMITRDLAAARRAWIERAGSAKERRRREASCFLADRDARGRVVDFHALRMTFITNLSRSGVAPKTAQLLARHSDINLTMNTYTQLRRPRPGRRRRVAAGDPLRGSRR